MSNPENIRAWAFLKNSEPELFAKLWRLHFKIEAFYNQANSKELKLAIDKLCTAIEYCYCLHNPSIAESSLRAEIDGWTNTSSQKP